MDLPGHKGESRTQIEPEGGIVWDSHGEREEGFSRGLCLGLEEAPYGTCGFQRPSGEGRLAVGLLGKSLRPRKPPIVFSQTHSEASGMVTQL